MESSGRVLVVDDELRICRSVARLLRGQFEVMVANDGDEALELLANGQRFDAILCDLSMARVSGTLFRDAVRRRWRDQAQRIVFLTASADSAAADPVRDHLVLPKPFEAAALRELVRRVVEASRSGYFPEAA